MNKYDSYKDSDIQWIGKIPISWNTKKLKFLGTVYGGLTGKKGDDFGDEDNPKNKQYIPYTNIFNNTFISSDHFDHVVLEKDEKQNLVKKNDLFILMSSENYEDLGRTSILVDDCEELYLNSFCKGFRITKENMNPIFINYQLQGHLHRELISVEGSGFTRINLRQDKLLNTPILITSFKEQNKIVSYLDNKVHQIDELKIKIQQKIELLREQRTTVINEVVTKGLNPNVEMKESGVEWIGKIPSHWNIIRGKYILKILTGVYPSEIIEDKDGEHFVKVDDLNYVENSYYLSSSKLKIRDFGKNTLEGGIILFPKRGMTIFTNKVVITKSRCFIDPNLMGIKVFDSFNKIFLFYLLKNRGLGDICDSSTIPQINNKHIYPLKFVNPPINEQEQIVLYLDKKLKLIDESISKEEKRVKLLKEYKQSLISEVVTGKKKVV